MDFLDNSGHIFSLQSYNEEPVGYEFEENKYIFWIDAPTTNLLSINNYYAKTINFLVYYDDVDNATFDDLVNIEISLSSNKFWLLKPQQIQSIINDNKSLNDFINIDNDDLLTKLTNDDLIAITLSDDINSKPFQRHKVAIIPIYVITTSDDEGSWISNILIHITNKNENIDAVDEEFCPISIGGIYAEENEILTINGQNMGVKLPKEMFKAIYQYSYINDTFNEQLYNEKLREYLLNFMDIKGELGNYNSVQKSLEWFGYGNKITLSKLLRTDNEFKMQYVKDFFNINTDLLDSFKAFTNSTLIILTLKENDESDELYEQNFSNFFWGENKPYLIDIANSLIPVEVGINNDTWTYYKNYYNYSLYELGLKLSCLKYYYQKYFLPIHLKIHSASITHKVYANDIKFNNYIYSTNRTEHPIELTDSNRIEFDNNHIKYFTNQIHYINDQFNEFESFSETDDVYEINDVCLNIPIKFKNDIIKDDNNIDKEIPTYFNCTLLLEKEKTVNEDANNYILKIIDKPFNIFYYDMNIYDINKSLLNMDSYLYRYRINDTNEWSIYTIGINNFKEYVKDQFNIKLYSKNSDDNLETWNIDITYNDNLYDNYDIIIDFNKIFNEYNYLNNIEIQQLLSLDDNKLKVEKNPIVINTKDYYIYIPSIKEFNVNLMYVDDIIGNMIIIPKINVEMKFDQTEISDFKLQVNNQSSLNFSIKEKIKINYIQSTSLIYESHFNFVQDVNDSTSIYNCFVLYPKILNDNNINYFIDQNYILRLLVNNRWYEYKFTSKLQDIYLDFGTLSYKYWNTSDNYYSYFSQLSDLTPTSIKFNSYLHEPDLVSVNSIKFMTDIEEYVINNNISYINNDILKHLTFDKYIQINNCKIWFINDYLEKVHNVNINMSDLNNYNEIYIINENLIFGAINSSTYKIFKNTNNTINKLNKNLSKTIDQLYINTNNEYMHLSNNTYNIFVEYVNNDNVYNANVELHRNEIYQISSNKQIYNTYQDIINIKDNKDFLNNVYIYDLYEKVEDEHDVLSLYSSFELSCNGLVFKHSVYDNDNNETNKININGTTLWTNQYYGDDEFISKYNEWNGNDKDENKGYIISKIIDKYGFYWGNNINKLETITQENQEEFFYYFNDKYNIPQNTEYYNNKSTIKVGEIILNNYTELNDNLNIVTTNEIESIYQIIKAQYIDDEFKLTYINKSNHQQFTTNKIISKIEYVKDNIVTNIDNVTYLRLLTDYIGDIKIRITLYINYEETLHNSIKTIDNVNQIYYDSNNNPYIIINNENIYLYKKYIDYDQRNNSKIMEQNPKNYIWSAKHLFDLDENNYKSIDLSAINNYLEDTGDLNIYWHSYDNLKSLQENISDLDFSHGRSYLQKNILNYLTNIQDTFKLSWESSSDKIYCEVIITRQDNSTEIISENGAEFELYKTDKNAILYFVVETTGEVNESIENEWIIPHIYNKTSKYQQIKYLGDIKNSHEINATNIHLLYDYNNSESVINLYNEFFNEGIYDKTHRQLLTKYVYEVEKLYNIENQYNIWKLSNSFNIFDEYNDNCVKVVYEDIIKYYQLDENLSFNNFINLVKYDFSFINKLDFYNVKVYDYNNKEIIESDYINNEKYVKVITQNIDINDDLLDYDLYLMHNLEYWYIVFISKETISKKINYNNNLIQEILPNTSTDKYTNHTKYKLTLSKQTESFLINRMKYTSKNGINHFNINDIIAAKISNMKLPVNIYASTKWEIIPKSIGMDKTKKINSNSEFTILSLPTNNNEHQKGYYDVNLRYCIDNNIQHQIIKKGKFRIS